MIYLDNGNSRDITFNLALEEYAVRNFDPDDEGYLLLYENEPAVVLGKHQNPLMEMNQDFIDEFGIRVSRRISGGGTVYHDEMNLNFSYITKFDNRKIHNFAEFTKPITSFLRKIGVESSLDERSNIIINGKKISGNAQFSNTKQMISHGTLLFDSNLEQLRGSLNVVNPGIVKTHAVRSVSSSVTNIKEHLKTDLSYDDFKEGVKNEILRDRNEGIYKLKDDEIESVKSLAEEKYKNWDWVYGRTPPFDLELESGDKISINNFTVQKPVSNERNVQLLSDFGIKIV